MSLLASVALILLFAGGCFGSWKAALYWNLRTREAQEEDPRDQEIRELGAALSIARKELARSREDTDAHSTQAIELGSKLENASTSLSDIKQKFNATKENLNREIEQREEMTEEITVLRRELEQAKAQVTELEVQVRVEHSSSDMIAGMDMVDEAEDSTDLQRQLDEARTEADRWKQHCSVLTQTNKGLRAQLDIAEQA